MNEYIYKTSNENRFSETGEELPCFYRSKYPAVEWECGKKEGLSRPWGGKGGQRRGLASAEHGLYRERPWARSSRNRTKAGSRTTTDTGDMVGGMLDSKATAEPAGACCSLEFLTFTFIAKESL